MQEDQEFPPCSSKFKGQKGESELVAMMVSRATWSAPCYLDPGVCPWGHSTRYGVLDSMHILNPAGCHACYGVLLMSSVYHSSAFSGCSFQMVHYVQPSVNPMVMGSLPPHLWAKLVLWSEVVSYGTPHQWIQHSRSFWKVVQGETLIRKSKVLPVPVRIENKLLGLPGWQGLILLIYHQVTGWFS